MTNSMHTPGPWSATPNGSAVKRFNKKTRERGGYIAILKPQTDYIIHPCGKKNADGTEGYFKDNGQKKANAHLIAAAPDLLEALEQSQKCLEELLVAKWGDWVCFNDSVIWCKNRAAIAKARGE